MKQEIEIEKGLDLKDSHLAIHIRDEKFPFKILNVSLDKSFIPSPEYIYKDMKEEERKEYLLREMAVEVTYHGYWFGTVYYPPHSIHKIQVILK